MHLQLSWTHYSSYSIGSNRPPFRSRETHRTRCPKAWTCQVQQRGATLSPTDHDRKIGARDDDAEASEDLKKTEKRVFSDEHRAKLVAAWEKRPRGDTTGKKRTWKLSDETKARMAASWKEKRPRQLSDEHRAKIAAAQKANPKVVSDETREKISLANRGRQHSITTRSKMAHARLGRRIDEETRLKMSRAQKLRWQKRKQQQQATQQAQQPKQHTQALQASWEDEQLSREAAVFELVKLRREVGHIVSELNMRGELPETAEEVGLHPNVHRKLWRYVWLLDQVRSAPLM